MQGDIKDWEIESAKMASIYSNSFLTLAATAGSNPYTGLFLRRWTRFSMKSSDFHAQNISTSTRRDILEIRRNGRLSIQAVSITHPDQDNGIYVRPQLHLAHDRFKQTRMLLSILKTHPFCRDHGHFKRGSFQPEHFTFMRRSLFGNVSLV